MQQAEEKNTIITLPFRLDNPESYDLAECSNLLRNLESLEEQAAKANDFRRSIRNIDSQLNYTMFF